MENTSFKVFTPQSHWDCTLANLDWSSLIPLKIMVEELLDGKREKGIVLIGDPGLGKTHIQVGIFREMLDRGRTIGLDMFYIQWSDYVQSIFNSMEQGGNPERLVISTMENVKMLILDDVKSLPGRMWKEVLKKIIEQAYETNKILIWSTNANNVEELIKHWELEDYWLSRLLSCCDIVRLKGQDRRGK